jgi:hypothetical protein
MALSTWSAGVTSTSTTLSPAVVPCVDAGISSVLNAPTLPSDIKTSRFANSYWQFLASGQKFLPQDDPALMSIPILRSDDGSSELCGSMCALHWTEVVRKIENIPPPYSSEPDELQAVATVLATRDRDSRIIIRNGLLPGQLTDVIQTLLTQSKITKTVQTQVKDPVIVSETITMSDFFSGDQNDALFIRVNGPSKVDSTALDHFVLKVGANSSTNELMVLDPYAPNSPVRAKITDLSASGKGFQIAFPPESHLSTFNLSIEGLEHAQFQFSQPTP